MCLQRIKLGKYWYIHASLKLACYVIVAVEISVIEIEVITRHDNMFEVPFSGSATTLFPLWVIHSKFWI